MSRGAPTHGRSRGPAQARERDRAGLSGLLEVLVSAHPCVCARACRSSSPCCSPPSLLYRRGSFWTLQRLDRAPPDAASRAAASRAACRVNPKQVVYRGSPVCVCKRACVREKEREKERGTESRAEARAVPRSEACRRGRAPACRSTCGLSPRLHYGVTGLEHRCRQDGHDGQDCAVSQGPPL